MQLEGTSDKVVISCSSSEGVVAQIGVRSRGDSVLIDWREEAVRKEDKVID